MPGNEHGTRYGWLAWSQVIASFLISFCTLGLGNSYGAFQSYYQHNILESYSPSDISWIGTTQGFLLSIVGIISGPLYDRGYMKSLVYAGTALNVLGLVATSFSTNYAWTFVSYGVILGLGFGILYVPAQAAVQAHFTCKAALPTGISMAGSSVGGIIFPIMFRQLVEAIGFAWACRAIALMSGVLLMVACALVKPPPKPIVLTQTQDTIFNFRVLYDWKLLLFGCCALVLDMGIDVPFYFIPTFVQERLKRPPEIGDSLLAAMNGSSLFGRIFLSWLAGHLGPLRVFHSSILAACVLLLCWFTVDSLAGIIAFIIFFGFFVGGLMSLIPSSVAEIFPDTHLLGARIGLVEGFQGVGILIGPPIAGAIMDSPAGYLGVSVFCGALYFALILVMGVFTFRRRSATSLEEGGDEILELQDRGAPPGETDERMDQWKGSEVSINIVIKS
ncbi:MFS general substrate transporter [Hypoxylon sp. NC1633]|nr:MFS general substrate transporter [Hypoxylon sp. NC1633]